jgi:hypothetical protein
LECRGISVKIWIKAKMPTIMGLVQYSYEVLASAIQKKKEHGAQILEQRIKYHYL